MVDFGIFTKNADIQARAGANANTTAKATDATDVYVLNVESTINVKTRKNWSDAFGTLNADVKGLLTDTGACLCAIYVIQYDMSGFTSLEEATTMCDILWATANRNMQILADINMQDFTIGA